MGQVVSANVYSLSDAALSYDPEIRRLSSMFGIYLLYRNNELVYIGKVSGSIGKLKGRLRQHLSKIKLSIVRPDEMTCKMIPVPDKPLILAMEEMLIKKFIPKWNGMDFGGNLRSPDEKSRVKPSKWVQEYIACLSPIGV